MTQWPLRCQRRDTKNDSTRTAPDSNFSSCLLKIPNKKSYLCWVYKFAKKREVFIMASPFPGSMPHLFLNWTFYDVVELSETFWITMTRVLFWSLCSLCHAKKSEIWEVGSHTWSNPVTCQTILYIFVGYDSVFLLSKPTEKPWKQKLSGFFDDYFGHCFELEFLLELRTSRLWCRIQKYKGLGRPGTLGRLFKQESIRSSHRTQSNSSNMTVCNKLVLIPAVLL